MIVIKHVVQVIAVWPFLPVSVIHLPSSGVSLLSQCTVFPRSFLRAGTLETPASNFMRPHGTTERRSPKPQPRRGASVSPPPRFLCAPVVCFMLCVSRADFQVDVKFAVLDATRGADELPGIWSCDSFYCWTLSRPAVLTVRTRSPAPVRTSPSLRLSASLRKKRGHGAIISPTKCTLLCAFRVLSR